MKDTKQALESALPILEDAIKSILGPEVSDFDFGLTINEFRNRKGEICYEITSKDLVDLTGAIGKMTYESYKFSTWGGMRFVDDDGENKIWFNPKFFFKYGGGGSNGTDAFWSSLWYNLDANEWVFGRRL